MATRVSRMVRLLMADAGENQSTVARVLGVPQSAVSARLRGQTKWTVDDLEVLARHYGKSITVFFLDPDEMLSPPATRGRLPTSNSFSCSTSRPSSPSSTLRTRLHRPARFGTRVA